MLILITKDASTKIAREVRDLDEARGFQLNGFHVELLDEQGNTSPLPAPEGAGEAPPIDDAFVAVGSTRFSDGGAQTEESQAAAADAYLKAREQLAAAPAEAPAQTPAPAKKAAKAAPKPAAKPTAKKAPAKKAR